MSSTITSNGTMAYGAVLGRSYIFECLYKPSGASIQIVSAEAQHEGESHGSISNGTSGRIITGPVGAPLLHIKTTGMSGGQEIVYRMQPVRSASLNVQVIDD